LLFAREVFSVVKVNAPGLPILMRVSGNEMSLDFGLGHEALLPLLKGAENHGIAAVHFREIRPDLLVWATGVLQSAPGIPGIETQHAVKALEFFTGGKAVRGPRVLVIGAGRTGLEILEKLGKDGYELVATKRTDPLGSMMEMITRNTVLTRIDQMPKVTLMPHTTVKAFFPSTVDIEQDGVRMSLEPFQTGILASGTVSAPGPGKEIESAVSIIEIIGDAKEVADIYSTTQAGYQLACRYS
jgi:NADPH-dependent 2,4-dienoyl-CoA reductase/sulfur reductase-like enzyme